MSNTATTALMAPIAVSIAQGMGADPSAVLMACVIGGSCAYATPIGMPANTMVVTAGGYTFNLTSDILSILPVRRDNKVIKLNAI